MAMINIGDLNPQLMKMKVEHPFTGDTTFQNSKGEDIEGIIHIKGVYSKEYTDVFDAIIGNKNVIDPTITEARENDITLLIACVVGWDDNGFIDKPYSPEEADALLRNPEYKWLAEQISNYIKESSNFFGRPSTN